MSHTNYRNQAADLTQLLNQKVPNFIVELQSTGPQPGWYIRHIHHSQNQFSVWIGNKPADVIDYVSNMNSKRSLAEAGLLLDFEGYLHDNFLESYWEGGL